MEQSPSVMLLVDLTETRGLWPEKAMAPQLQYSCLENSMDGGAWWAAVHGVTKSQARLSDFPFTFHFHALEKEMATHSSVLAWRIPGTGEPGRLQSIGLQRAGPDLVTKQQQRGLRQTLKSEARGV